MREESRLLGIDYGQKRTGVALSDPLGIIATPLTVIATIPKRGAFERLAALAKDHGVTKIVLGLPTDSEGQLGQQALAVLRWARQLAERTSVQVVLWDESFSTEDAAELTQHGKRGRQLDAVAAAVILQSYLEARRTVDEPGQPLQAFEDDAARPS